LDVFADRPHWVCSGGFYFCNVSENKNNFQNLWLSFGCFCDMKEIFSGASGIRPEYF